jgi:hypothetical protein
MPQGGGEDACVVGQGDETPLTREEANARIALLMKIDATLERIEEMLREEDDGEEETDE